MRLVDPHAHLAGERFREDLPEVLERMRGAGMEKCIVISDPCEEPPDFAAAQALAETQELLYFAAGVHPHNAKRWSDDAQSALFQALKHPRAVALGEIGLDYHYDLSPRDVQIAVFERQLDLAHDWNLPVQMHIREAHGDAMDILRAHHRAGTLPSGDMHCFSGSWETAKTYLDMGLFISFSGSVTFKNASKLLEVAKNVPAERLLVETDCPYMAPEPLRGRRNEPTFVRHTLLRVAELRGDDPEWLADRVFQNACALFRLG